MGRSRGSSWGVVLALLVLGAIALEAPLPARGEEPASPAATAYPLGTSLQVLERDLTSPEYLEVLETMIPTDLAAEWKRVATEDNYETFLQKHGGREKVFADPQLKQAYERRKEIADRFLDLMRKAYAKRKQKAPFDNGETIDLLQAGSVTATAEKAKSLPVRVVMPVAGAERQWPRFRGPSGQGDAIDTDFPLTWSETENVLWKTELPGVGNGSPIVWDDRIFLTAAAADETTRWVLCFARDTGKELWRREAPKPETQEKLYWKNSYASATPVTDGERVVALLGNSGLICFDFEGNQQWHRDLGEFSTTHGPGTSPLLYKDKVIVLQDQNRADSVFAAFDKKTGKTVWERERPRSMGWSTPVILRIGDRDVLVYNGSNKIVAYDPETGESLWTVGGSSIESIPTIVVGDGLIYSTSGRNGPSLALRPTLEGEQTQMHVEWKLPRGGPHVPSPAYHDGRLYIVNDTGIGTCLDASNGKTLWQQRLRGRFSMSPIVAGDRILVTSETGTTYVLKAGPEFEILATNELNDDVLATPAVLGGRLYFRTKTQLLCIAADAGKE